MLVSCLWPIHARSGGHSWLIIVTVEVAIGLIVAIIKELIHLLVFSLFKLGYITRTCVFFWIYYYSHAQYFG
jgi:hypothetical protein